MRRTVAMCAAMAVMGLLETVHGGLAPHVTDRPHRLTAAKLTAYVNRTFGPSQRCLRVVVADDAAETAAIVAMLHGRDQRPHPEDGNTCSSDDYAATTTTTTTVARSIELDEPAEDDPVLCQAYVVVGRQPSVVEKCFDNFRNTVAAHRMLVIVVQDNKFIEPFIKYSPEYFNYKDVILINVYPQKETVYQMSINFEKFIPISNHPEQWYSHDLEGKHKVKNFHQTRIKLLAYNNSFFSSVIINNETGKLSLSHGVECSIFQEIARRLNVTWDVYTSEDNDKWGTVWSNNTVTGGALRWLTIKQVDVSFCSLWIEKTKLKFVDMSRFWAITCLKFLVPKPKPLREKWDLLFKPFPLSLWLLVFFSATLTTFTMWILAGIQKKIGYERISAFTSLSSTIFWIIGMMLLTNNPRTYRMGPIRHLINWWCMFVFIMSTSFSSVLYSYMTSPEYNKLVLEVEDMVKSNYHWGLTYPPPFDFILKMQNPVHQVFSKRFVAEHSVADRISRLERGKYAMLAKCLNEKHFMESEQVPVEVLSDLRTTRTCLNQFYVGFGFVRGSPYVRPANLVLQRIFESGLIDYWLSRVTENRINTAAFKRVYETKPHKSGHPTALSYRQFKVLMVVWTVGCALSIVVFAVERLHGSLPRVHVGGRW